VPYIVSDSHGQADGTVTADTYSTNSSVSPYVGLRGEAKARVERGLDQGSNNVATKRTATERTPSKWHRLAADDPMATVKVKRSLSPGAQIALREDRVQALQALRACS